VTSVPGSTKAKNKPCADCGHSPDAHHKLHCEEPDCGCCNGWRCPDHGHVLCGCTYLGGPSPAASAPVSVPGSRDPALTDDIIEAAAKAVDGHEWRDDEWEHMSPGWKAERRAAAEAALAAVLPLLRAHIAEVEIESEEMAAAVADVFVDAMDFGDWDEALRYGHGAVSRVAARVARGGDQDG
jgi:hypothetical protein